MLKLKEIIYIIFASAVIGYVIAFSQMILNSTGMSWNLWIKYSLLGLIILGVNVIAKKIAAYKLGCEVEIIPWNVSRYWFYESAYLRYPIPAWVVWPILVVWASSGRLWWLVVMGFDVYATRNRVGRKFAELTEWDMALISAAGISSVLILAVVAASNGYTLLAFMSLWYVFFNMLPFPAYDGGRILFGDVLFYIFMATFSMIVIILLHMTTNVFIITASSLLASIVAIFVFYAIFEKPLK